MSDRIKYRAALEKQRRDRDLATTPVPHRITTALDLCGLEGPGVDEALGVEEPTVDRWETGELVPTAEEIGRLAELTGYPKDYFYLPVTMPGGWTFVCSSGGCEQVWVGPPPQPEPEAAVIPLHRAQTEANA